jgi:prepilin-type N-terminal cleavage/methylation domain-containing protein/prepilin-type processing-associated H-X9-DG protein
MEVALPMRRDWPLPNPHPLCETERGGFKTPGRGRSILRDGFTLVELLVVIAIIAILAAVLFPVFALARNRAQNTTCQSNLKQLASAFEMYLDNWDGTYPNSWQAQASSFGDLNHSWWDEQVAPYVKSDGVFACPTNDTESFSVQQAFNSQGVKTRRVTYSLNNQLLHCPPGAFRFSYEGDPEEPANDSEIESPSETILLAEKMLDEPNHAPSAANEKGNQSSEIDVWYHLTGPGLDPSDWNPTWGVARALHNKGSNFVFTDGHVKRLRLQDTFAPASSPDKDTGVRAPASDQDTPAAPPSEGAGTMVSPEGSNIDPYLWKLNKKDNTGG